MKYAKFLKEILVEKEYFRLMTDAFEIRILFLTDDILRIRAAMDDNFSEASYTLAVTAWEDQMDELLKDERTRIQPAKGRLIDDPSEKEALLGTFPGALSYPPFITAKDIDVIKGEKLTVLVLKFPFMLKIYDKDGDLVHEDIPLMGWQKDANNRRLHYSYMGEDYHYYGFGERTGSLDKREKSMKLSPADAMGYNPAKNDGMYKHIPFFIRLDGKTKKSCGYFYHNTYEGRFDMGSSHSNYVKHHSSYTTDGGDIDLFLITGASFRQVEMAYTYLTGRSVMLPKAALGYLGSSMYYPELPKGADQAILDFIDTTREEDIPVDGFQLSSGYCEIPTAEGLKRCTFTWNHDKFPNPEDFFRKMTEKGVTVSSNVKPGMLLCHPLRKEMEEKGMFIKDSSTEAPAGGLWWGGLGYFVDFTNPVARQEWKKYLKDSLLKYGTTSVWNDNCEYEGIVDKDSRVDFEGKGATIAQTRVLMANLMCQLSQEAVKEAHPNQRPFIVCRSGHAGIQRYAQTWAGDNMTSWETLKHNVATILGMSVSGVANHGCDIGGFYGPAPEEELFVRWVQNGIFQPRFSIHSTNTDNTVTEPWMYSGSKHLIQDAMHFRYQLSPYLYSLMYRASQEGLPIMEPLVSAFPEDEVVYNEGKIFMEGDSLLVANVLEKGVDSIDLYLPKGVTFYDFYTREEYEGGKVYEIPVDLSSIPLFIKEGAILPIAMDKLTNLTQDTVKNLKLLLAPAGTTNFVYYDDDGTTLDYEKGVYTRTEITMQSGEQTTVDFKTTGSYESPVENIYIDMIHRSKAPFTVFVDNKELEHFLHRKKFEEATEGWYYSQTLKSVQIKYTNPKKDYRLLVNFEAIDLIGM